MRHAGPRALTALAPLLADIRALGLFVEKKPGIFYLKSRSALHFHEADEGLYADLRLEGADFERLRVDEADGAERLLARLSAARAKRP